MMTTELGEQLAKQLLERDRYSGRNVLETYLDEEVRKVAKGIAAEVVASSPELTDLLRKRCTEVVIKLLADNWTFEQKVVQAIVETLAKTLRDEN